AAAPVTAKPADPSKDDAAARQQNGLAQKDSAVSIAPLENLPHTPPPVAAPVPVAPPPPPPPPAAPVAFISNPQSVMTQKLDELHKQVTSEAHTIRLVAGSATVVSLGLSVLYILWTIRAGYLLASLLSSMPAWSFVDPLSILDHFDNALDRRRRRDGDGHSDDGDGSFRTLVHRQGAR